MTELYGRAIRAIIGGLEFATEDANVFMSVPGQAQNLLISNLDMAFRVERTLDAHSDTLELTIYNLSEQHRNQLLATDVVTVQLEAGYRSRLLPPVVDVSLDNTLPPPMPLPLLFGGDLRQVRHHRGIDDDLIFSHRECADWITELKSGDGDKAKKLRINKAFGPGTPLRFAIEQVASELGLGADQLLHGAGPAENLFTLADGSTQFVNGVVLSGNGYDQLKRLLENAGYRWYIQNNEICVVKVVGGPLSSAAIVSAETGMVGTPIPGNDGRVSVSALLQPDIMPGRQIVVRSKHVNGYYIVEKAVYVGDTANDDWYVDMDVVSLEQFVQDQADKAAKAAKSRKRKSRGNPTHHQAAPIESGDEPEEGEPGADE